jgi:hypothetical protein
VAAASTVYHHASTDTFPPRYVSETHWQRCDACGRQFRMWWAMAGYWQLLPPSHRKASLCTRCFREAVGAA